MSPVTPIRTQLAKFKHCSKAYVIVFCRKSKKLIKNIIHTPSREVKRSDNLKNATKSEIKGHYDLDNGSQGQRFLFHERGNIIWYYI